MKYIKYLLYVIEHKKNVFIECWKASLYLHAFTHDLSKFLPSEFIPYARFFMGNGSKKEFDKAWELHYNRNKHHPEHWNGKDIPIKHIEEMVCDLKAMSRKFGGTAQEYYLKNYYKWELTHHSRRYLEIKLDLIREFNAPICEGNWEFWATIEELIKDSEEYYKAKGKISEGNPEKHINWFLKPACDKYDLNIYSLFKESNK